MEGNVKYYSWGSKDCYGKLGRPALTVGKDSRIKVRGKGCQANTQQEEKTGPERSHTFPYIQVETWQNATACGRKKTQR